MQQNTRTAAGGSILRAYTEQADREREIEVSIYTTGRETERER